jgi:hypothetical protein
LSGPPVTLRDSATIPPRRQRTIAPRLIGRSCEARYALTETESADYPTRTERNVQDSDGTVIINVAPALSRGSKLTAKFGAKHGKPCIHIHSGVEAPGIILRGFVEDARIQTLNVAGPRASNETGVADFVRAVLDGAFDPRRATVI